MPNITADFAANVAPMKIMHSVNNAPVGETTRLCDEMSNHKYFREAGIPYCRNHDAGLSPAYDGEFVVDAPLPALPKQSLGGCLHLRHTLQGYSVQAL